MSRGGGEARRRNDRSGKVFALGHRFRTDVNEHHEFNPLSASHLLAPRCTDIVGHHFKKM